MAQMYGPAFLTAYGESPSPLWLSAIERLTDEKCRKGLTRLAKEARDYPANLTQFVAACNHTEPVRFLGVPLTAQQIAALIPPPEKRAKPEVIDKWIASMRKSLG